MSKVRVVFSRNKSWTSIFSNVIMFFEQIKYDHCAIIVDGDMSFVYESTVPKSRVMALEEWSKSHEIVKEYQLSACTPDKLIWLRRNIGKPYSFSQLFFIGVGIIFSPAEKLMEKWKINGSRFLICTELVGRYLIEFEQIKFNETPDTLSLTEIVEVLEDRNGEG